jgi:hypothetical protein
LIRVIFRRRVKAKKARSAGMRWAVLEMRKLALGPAYRDDENLVFTRPDGSPLDPD